MEGQKDATCSKTGVIISTGNKHSYYSEVIKLVSFFSPIQKQDSKECAKKLLDHQNQWGKVI